MFSYKAQVDDAMEEDTVSLPHQQSFSSLKTDSDYIYQVHSPCFYAPLFHSQRSQKACTATKNRRLVGSSSHATLLYHDYAAQRRLLNVRSRANFGRTSAPDLRSRREETSEDEPTASASKVFSSDEAENSLHSILEKKLSHKTDVKMLPASSEESSSSSSYSEAL